MKKLAVLSTHPIQYNAPFYELLGSSKNIQLKVFYTWGESCIKKYDPGFGKIIEWDIPLLDGYDYQFPENVSKDPGSHHFNGIDNPSLEDEIKSFAPDAILIYGWSYKSHYRVLRKFSGKTKLWFRGDSNLLDPSPIHKRILRQIFLRWVYSHLDLCFYVGSANKTYFRKFGLNEGQLKFSPHAIDNARFSKDRITEVQNFRENLNIPPHGIVALFAGKLEQKKDPIGLLQSFENINNPEAFLIFAGNGNLEGKLKEGIAKSFSKERIRLLPFQNQSQMPILYQASDLFCLPSLGPGETWGLAVNEAMAAGKAILVSDKVGCATDLVKEGKNGIVFKAGDHQDLNNKLAFLLRDKSLLKEMGNYSSEIIKDWTIANQAKAVEEELKRL